MVISLAKRSASRTISSKALRRISARSRGLRAAQPAKASCAASIAALASSTLALATEAILFSVAGSITSKRAPSEALRHLPPIHRSVGTLASRLSYMAMLSSSALQRAPHCLGDAVDRRQDRILQRVGGGQRNVRRRDAHWRAVEVVERLVGDDRHDLGAPAAQPRVLLHGENAMGAADGTQDRLGVERHQRAHIDNFRVDAVFRLEPF